MPRTRFRPAILAGLGVVVLVVVLSLGDFSGWFGGPVKKKLPVGGGAPAISLGERHGLILASDGSLWSWGSDLLGWPVLGLGKGRLKSTMLRRIGGDTNWAGISAGENFNLAIKSDGTLWTWGAGKTALHTRMGVAFAPVPAAPGNDWKQAAAGGNVAVAVKKNGTLWAWGNNWAGSVGIASTNGSNTPEQIGSSTNWTRVWAGILETVGLQSDGSLWYWGDNPDPTYPQGKGQIFTPTRVNGDTDWVDVGFGVNTMFALKSNGTLWVWGRNAERYTGASDPAQDAVPARVGKDSDWGSICATTGWWISGLVKKDGSLWVMDGSDGKPNGPTVPYGPALFRRIEFATNYAAAAAGAIHAAPAGVHGPIGVLVEPDGEVRTWGMVLGDPPTLRDRWESIEVGLYRFTHPKARVGDPTPDPIYREQPWQLGVTDEK